MISLAQQQRPMLDSDVLKPQPLAKLEGFESIMMMINGYNPTTMAGASPINANNPLNESQIFSSLQPTGEERKRFSDLFNQSAKQGLLDGQTARQLFMKSNLPGDILAQIWQVFPSLTGYSL